MNLLIFNALSWEQRKLAELVTRYEDPVETPHDGYIRLGIRSHAKGTFHEYVEPGHELETAQMHRVAANKLIFNITFAWEHAVAITTEDDAGKLVSHRFPQFSLSELLRPEFLKYVILDEGFHHKLYLASHGGAGRNRVLKVDEALDYPIFFPSVEEQHKIGEFLNQLNDLITLHQSKAESWKNKENQLSTISWEQRKVGEVIEDYVEKTTVQNQYPVLTSSQQQGIVLQEDYFADRQVTTNDNVGYYVLPRGYFTYRSRSDTDLFVFNRNNLIDKGIISYYYPVFRPKNADSNFLLRRLNNGIRSQVSMAAEGTGQHVLAHSKLKNMELLVPSVPEQKLIGAYFEILDNLITLHHRKLNRTQICINRSFLYGSF